jgi:branched-chain amino acid transport system permease protein
MITLAVASSFAVLASQLSDWTGGEDGKTFDVPELLSPANEFGEFMGRIVDGKVLTYYIVFFCAALIFLALLRVVNSPFGRVLQAIRENEFRAEALGYRTVLYRIAANCIGAVAAALAGALMALWLRYVGPKTTLGFEVMTDILLIVVIGGMGTMYGAVLGAALFILANNYLKTLMAQAAGAVAGVPLLEAALHPDRWLLWLGILFILAIYFFPSGIVGRLRRAA